MIPALRSKDPFGILFLMCAEPETAYILAFVVSCCLRMSHKAGFYTRTDIGLDRLVAVLLTYSYWIVWGNSFGLYTMRCLLSFFYFRAAVVWAFNHFNVTLYAHILTYVWVFS